jgi:membrane-associated protease RseP (regulator of RpoE activity)
LKHTEMFSYFGGPGHPTPEHPNFFGWVGPLTADPPVITIGGTQGYDSGYGPFTGAIPYPEATFAPYTTTAAAGGVASGVSTPTPYAPGGTSGPAAMEAVAPPRALPGSALGFEIQPAVDAAGVRGLKVTQIYPGSLAERVGVRLGDVIHSINGYATEQPGNLTWIIANAAPDRVLQMNVRAASDGKINTYRVQLP